MAIRFFSLKVMFTQNVKYWYKRLTVRQTSSYSKKSVNAIFSWLQSSIVTCVKYMVHTQPNALGRACFSHTLVISVVQINVYTKD